MERGQYPHPRCCPMCPPSVLGRVVSGQVGDVFASALIPANTNIGPAFNAPIVQIFNSANYPQNSGPLHDGAKIVVSQGPRPMKWVVKIGNIGKQGFLWREICSFWRGASGCGRCCNRASEHDSHATSWGVA